MQFLKAVISILLSSFIPVTSAYASDRTAYDFTFESIEGEPMPLSEYAGKTLLIVNTASKCGFTGQYDGLEQLWERYRDRGLVIIAVPSSDFKNQEPGSNEEIRQFCKLRFGVTFPLTTKQHVIGKEAHPLFTWLGETLGKQAIPKWNFYKYVIDSEGKPVDYFLSTTSPTSDRVIEAIEKNLPPRYSLQDIK